jgi:large subunit ribosomal protein L23
MNIYDIIKKPVVTEKTEMIRRQNNEYTFEVDKRANKLEIRNAVEKIFNVNVERVNTLNIKPKAKRYGMKEYKTSLIKKAIVKLKEGDQITYFEGV